MLRKRVDVVSDYQRHADRKKREKPYIQNKRERLDEAMRCHTSMPNKKENENSPIYMQ